jgi:pyruvate,water dikinase
MANALTRRFIRALEEVRRDDVGLVGGKNASLGELIGTLAERGVRVPGGFATTVEAYREFIVTNALDARVREQLAAYAAGVTKLEEAGAAIRAMIMQAEFPEALAEEIREAYRELSARHGGGDTDVAVRSSATAEDLVDASFAGQQDTYLNIRGEEEVLAACRRCYASLFTDRAISYRVEKGFDHMEVGLSVGVQKMVRSDAGCSGVMFTLDPETGFPGVVVINGSYGLGELLVQGAVDPDEFVVAKALLDGENFAPVIATRRGTKLAKMIYADTPDETVATVDTTPSEREALVLSEREALELARWGRTIEEHYGRPMDIEWAKDGLSGELFIVQARPETVQSQRTDDTLKQYELMESGDRLLQGVAIGEAIASGAVCVIRSAADRASFVDGCILVTEMTDPDWVPIMKRARGIITDRGGRTCHAAIVSRELGIPAIVGTGAATSMLENGQDVTLSCAEGDQGYVYRGLLAYEERVVSLDGIPETRTQLMLNIASPAAAFRWWRLPTHGIGLARMEFIINDVIKIHPMALVKYDELKDAGAREEIAALTEGYADKKEYFVDHLAEGIARIAVSQYPEPVIVRMSDFKTNEYADLIGGREFEPVEANPMLGFRGASRYYSDRYREGFALECQAIKRVRDRMGLTNVVIMIPFCRTLHESDRVLEVLAGNGLRRGENGLEVYMMCEIPSNVLLADHFAARFDGFSIGSNDLTQLVLGVDRDSGDLADLFDERDLAVKRALRSLMESARRTGTKVGVCGQAPSDYPDFAEFLVEIGIDSISLNPDSIIEVKRRIAEVEERIGSEIPVEPINVLDCPDGMVGVLFIDELQPPSLGATFAAAGPPAHSIPNDSGRARRIPSAFERKED